MDALRYAQDLVAFESTSNLSNVPVIDYVQDVLEQLAFAVERIEFEDANGVRKANVIGKKGDGSGGMAYFGHTDVVPADPWFTDQHGPFEPTIKDGKLYGRGSCDMKGSIACMLAAAEQFLASDLKHPLYITCTADEEIGYGGAAQVAEGSELFREMVQGKSNGIIGEPTMLEVVYAHKGTYGFMGTSRGRAAHSSSRVGINANLAMIPFLSEMKKIHDETEADPGWLNDEFDPPGISWNIGINDHTAAVNITPPQSVCTVYFRPMPGQDAQALLDRAQQAAEKCGIEFETLWRGQALYVDPKSDFVQQTLQLVGKERPQTVSYGTDGVMFIAMKKLVLFGPGNIAQAHTHDEWIAIDQIEQGTKMFTKLIRGWCCR
ncbi:MAG: M20 family metallopeptidase [Acidobacteriota bacterium]